MRLYKNISNKTLKINNRIIHPKQCVKLSVNVYNQYKNSFELVKTVFNNQTFNKQEAKKPTQLIVEKQVEVPVYQPTTYSTQKITSKNDYTDIVDMLSQINTTLQTLIKEVPNITFSQNIISNHKEEKKQEVKTVPKPVQIFDTDNENDLLKNLLENSIK